jgi:hypothetical protein
LLFCQATQAQLEDWRSMKADPKKWKCSVESIVFEDFECPFKIWERHPTFPPLSDSLQIAFDDEVTP